MPKTNVYEYFVAYFANGCAGNTTFKAQKLITTPEQIENVQRELRIIDSEPTVVIINIILLDSYNAEERKQQEKEPAPTIGYPHQ